MSDNRSRKAPAEAAAGANVDDAGGNVNSTVHKDSLHDSSAFVKQTIGQILGPMVYTAYRQGNQQALDALLALARRWEADNGRNRTFTMA